MADNENHGKDEPGRVIHHSCSSAELTEFGSIKQKLKKKRCFFDWRVAGELLPIYCKANLSEWQMIFQAFSLVLAL